MPKHSSDSSWNLLCSDIYVSHQLKLLNISIHFTPFCYTESAKVTVAVSPARLATFVGQEVIFNCVVKGNNLERVDWMRSDGRALPAHSYLAQNNSLVIERVESTDEGRYICMAVTRYGRGSS